MAKSLWSKWKRKMLAEKRKKNAPRELNRLKSILKVDSDILMKDVQEIATVVVPKQGQEKVHWEMEEEKGDMKMETEIKRNRKTLLDQNGQYPVWMNQRQRKKLKAKRAKGRGKSKAKAAKGMPGRRLTRESARPGTHFTRENSRHGSRITCKSAKPDPTVFDCNVYANFISQKVEAICFHILI
uniref:protein LLP homolog n=1 Tax=Jaculus jaculus TaxID=51337 RepID=UPI001E1B1C1A|nr:protein LLP homolog [Jaculus jaculus]